MNSTTNELPESVEVCIIGAGIIGVCIALTLAEKGIRVLVLEKGKIGAEQSSRNLGWVRQQGRDEAEFPLMVESNRLWQDMARRCDNPHLHFDQNGIIYLSNNEADAQTYEGYISQSKQYGVETKFLTAGEVQQYIHSNIKQTRFALITPSDGRVEPKTASSMIAKAAIKKGTRIIEGCTVTGIDTASGVVAYVNTEMGSVRAEQVIVSCGAWSSLLLGSLGISIPQLNIISTVTRVSSPEINLNTNVSDGKVSFYKCSEGIGVSLCDQFYHRIGPDTLKHFGKYSSVINRSLKNTRLQLAGINGLPGDWFSTAKFHNTNVNAFNIQRVFDPEAKASSVSKMIARIKNRFLIHGDVTVINKWAGAIDVLPDFVPMIDKVPDNNGLWVTTGFSGHGFGIAPVVGRIMGDLLRGNQSGYELSRFRFNRFNDGSRLNIGPTF